MLDFRLKLYKKMLEVFLQKKYNFLTFEDTFNKNETNYIILRHDVDLLPRNSLYTAQIEHKLGIRGTYYFRIIKKSYDPNIIYKIATLGHEIGYHYEDIAIAKGNIDKAYDSFCRNLEKIRKFYPVKTICMHGSPMSKWDSRLIWQKYDYRKLGIIG